MDSIAKMAQLRAALMDFAATVADGNACKYPSLFEAWETGKVYTVDKRVESGGKLWKCLQAHTSQTGWEPESVPALWVEVAAPGEYREIKASMLSTEAFALGEIGWWQTSGNLYRSLIAANVYTPTSYPAGWEAV